MQTVLKVDGMSCSHCENAVKGAVSAINGVTAVAVDLAAKTVTVSHNDSVDVSAIANAIEEQGYDVVK